MNWTQLLKSEMDTTYRTTTGLMDKVDPDSLQWKPSTGNNWMTMGQLLKHLSDGCGGACQAFLTGDWGLPPDQKIEDMKPEDMLPPAEKLPTIDSVDEARKLLEQDRTLALQMVDEAGEDALQNRAIAAPWKPGVELPLGRQFLQMVQHLDRHKSQLFYYLKLQGKTVDTGDLWG